MTNIQTLTLDQAWANLEKITLADFHVSVAQDMYEMHRKYQVREAVNKLTKEQLLEFLKFRFKFLQEELNEGLDAIQDGNPEEVVDALIDLVVIAVGTCDLFDVDFDKAWLEVLRANLDKKVGVKESRPNPWNLPDLIKDPETWIAPNHSGNHGKLTDLFS